MEKLWNDKYYLYENELLVNMTRLKKKMKEIGIVHLLENIRGKEMCIRDRVRTAWT